MIEDIRRRLFGYCCKYLPEIDDVEVDLNALIRRFLLFDTYIIQSVRFKEFPQLIKVLGYDFVTELLKSGGIKIHCYGFSIGQVRPQHEIKIRAKRNSAIVGPYTFEVIKEFKNKRNENISLYFKNSINSIDTLPLKKKIKLKQNILEQLENPPDNFGEETIENFRNDLWSKSLLIKTALLKSLEMSSGKSVTEQDFFVRVHRINEKDFEVETNLGYILGLEDLSLSTIIQKGMLSINDNNQKIEEMKTFNALPVFMEDELSIYQENSNFLLQTLSSDSKALEDRFTRVVRIKGFPEINLNNPDIKIDISKLIEIRNSKECKEFRDFLNTIDKDTDIELFDRLEGFKSKLNLLFNSTSGQIIRYLFYGGLGFTPGVGAFIGLGLGALDTFLLSKVLPKSGPISFIDKQLPSIFREL